MIFKESGNNENNNNNDDNDDTSDNNNVIITTKIIIKIVMLYWDQTVAYWPHTHGVHRLPPDSRVVIIVIFNDTLRGILTSIWVTMRWYSFYTLDLLFVDTGVYSYWFVLFNVSVVPCPPHLSQWTSLLTWPCAHIYSCYCLFLSHLHTDCFSNSWLSQELPDRSSVFIWPYTHSSFCSWMFQLYSQLPRGAASQMIT